MNFYNRLLGIGVFENLANLIPGEVDFSLLIFVDIDDVIFKSFSECKLQFVHKILLCRMRQG